MYFVIHKNLNTRGITLLTSFETIEEASKYADDLTKHLSVFERVSVSQLLFVLSGICEVIEEDEPE